MKAMAKNRGENTFLPLQKSDMMPVFTPLLSDTPAVGKEQQTSLPCLELFALRHTGSHHIDADQQTEHGKAEMIGYHCGEHDGGKGEKECRENVGIQPA